MFTLYAQRPAGRISVFKKLSVIQTEYFDFIFSEESALSARRLASCADTLYRKAAAHLQFQKALHIPVVITRDTDVFNAYYTAFPYNRIVLFDSVPPSSFSVFSDSLVSVFYHELVHALTFNIRSPLWDSLSSVFADALSPSFMLNFPPSFTEGAAVFFESMDTQGRLNDSYSMHVLRQAKIENKFPDWRSVTGAYGSYTDGSLPYIFGAAFTDYIQKKYGMHTYAELWKQGGRVHFFNLSAGIFKKVYGISLSQAWNGFESSVYIPPYEQAPESLFDDITAEYKNAQKGFRLYANLTSSPSGLAWYDYASSSVMFLPAKTRTPLFICRSDLSNRLVFSRSGTFLLLSGLRGTEKARRTLSVYDTQKKRFVLHTDAPDQASLIEHKGKTLLAGTERRGTSYSLVLYDFDELCGAAKTGKINPVKRINFTQGVFPLESADIGEGRILCLLEHRAAPSGKLVCSLFVYDTENETMCTYDFAAPDENRDENGCDINPVLCSPSVHDGVLYFSCALNARFQPVLARLDLKSLVCASGGVLEVQRTQYSGGVFWPAAFEDGIALISRFYEHRHLSIMHDFGDYYSLPLKSCGQNYIAGEPIKTDIKMELPVTAEVKPYRPLKYMKRGVLIPLVGFLNIDSFTPYVPADIPLGVSALTGDPVEHFLFIAGLGIDAHTHNFNANASLAFADYPAEIEAGFYTEAGIKTGLQRAVFRMHTDFEIPLVSNFAALYAANTAFFTYNAASHSDNVPYKDDGYSLTDRVQLGLKYTRRTGTGAYEYIGFNSNVQVFIKKNWDISGRPEPAFRVIHRFKNGFHMPFLLPFKNPRRFTLNLPFSGAVSAYINAQEKWGIESRFILFAYDIQKPLTFMPIFFRRICVDGGADAVFLRGGTTVFTVHGSLFSTLSFNSGSAASYPIDAGITLLWKPFEIPKHQFKLMFKFML
ncbi:hypothetical protein H0R92_08765 [Treponema sp. OMZ 840]|uniref:hypothetical protein n=1 Tax=Treponema sp. OMZ 840 TaxID=244313 RepID=UPI003D8FC696